MSAGSVAGRGAATWWGVVIVSAILGLGLAGDSALCSSATYDEVTYLKVAARWWRTGSEDAITRMGSPTLFWKIQQAVPLWCLDRAGFGRLIDEPEESQAILLPIVRLSCLPIWLVALATTAAWAGMLYGPKAMAMAASLFALSPNLLAHGPLATMETPLIACSAGMFLLFWRFLRYRERWAFAASAMVGGLAMSCKYTTVLLPPIFAVLWWADLRTVAELGGLRRLKRVALGMAGYLAILAATNLVLTGFSTAPLSPNTGKHFGVESRLSGRWKAVAEAALEFPVPREMAGFANQVRLQGQGGSSYLLGERRDRGWWHYYFVALAVKVPPGFWMLAAGRLLLLTRRRDEAKGAMMPLAIGLFLGITAIASTRNYGIRYLLPMAPAAIAWVSALAEAGWPWRVLAVAGLLGQAAAVATSHPNELSYFPSWAGGPRGGRHLLADSNLDWGQGLKGLARLQRTHPAYRDLTLYYFGETEPRHYGVAGIAHVVDSSAHHPRLPKQMEAGTRYVAVSSSLQFGPWGPPGYFRALSAIDPVFLLDDASIAIYDARAIPASARWPSGRSP